MISISVATFAAAIFLLFIVSGFLQSGTWFLLFHLSNYSISYRICKLTSFIKTSQLLTTTSTNFRIKNLRTTGYIFNQICLASNQLNLAFSPTVLLNLVILLIICTTSLFFFIFASSSLKIPVVIENNKWGMLVMAFNSIFMILVILISAELPIKAAINYLLLLIAYI